MTGRGPESGGRSKASRFISRAGPLVSVTGSRYVIPMSRRTFCELARFECEEESPFRAAKAEVQHHLCGVEASLRGPRRRAVNEHATTHHLRRTRLVFRYNPVVSPTHWIVLMHATTLRAFPSAILAIVMLAACASTAPQVEQTTTAPRNPFLIDPRTGVNETVSPEDARRFDAAWAAFRRGAPVEAERLFADIELRSPGRADVALALAAISLDSGDPAAAEELIARAEASGRTLASTLYRAEIARSRGDWKTAFARYTEVSRNAAAPPGISERLAESRDKHFAQLLSEAEAASDADRSAAMLRAALELKPEASNTRIQLVRKLIASSDWDEARRELDPLLRRGEADRTEVQEALADIDAGKGRFQEAIVRLEKLIRRAPDARLQQKLDALKTDFTSANMPPQYRRARESAAINRADFSVLLYWEVSSVRFATRLRQPPIAVDISNVIGRDELVRALALGLFNVDPITRRVDPYRVITISSFTRIVARVLQMRGAPCAGTSEPADFASAQRVLSSCGVSVPDAQGATEAPVSGTAAANTLRKVDEILSK